MGLMRVMGMNCKIQDISMLISYRGTSTVSSLHYKDSIEAALLMPLSG